MPKPAIKAETSQWLNAFNAEAKPPLAVFFSAVLLALTTVALYWPTLWHDFVNFDDDLYVAGNVHIQTGLTIENLKWSVLHPLNDNWHPLTQLSHMLDCQLFGLQPWGHHLTSVLLHALNTALVFIFLRGLTGAFWRSVMVAALFGWHPLHVESVAWVAERKDVLSTSFGLLALIFYVRYARFKIQNSKFRTQNYLLSLAFFALGLMSKPMLVTWPFVLLLLDYWPLNRISNLRFGLGDVKTLLIEKIPFFVFAVAVSIATFMIQKQSGAVQLLASVPLAARGENAMISYCRYLGKLFWPTHLAVFYPYPGSWPLQMVLLAGVLLVAILLLVFWQLQKPYLLFGWLWFLGTLLPVIGLVQVGDQAMADRYAYIPSLGVLILIVWLAEESTRSWRHQVMTTWVAGAAVLILLMALTRQQLGYWQNSETLFRHALAVTSNNYVAQNHLGDSMLEKGQIEESSRHFQEALRLNPDYALAHNNLGCVLRKKDQLAAAIVQFHEAVRLKPNLAEACFNLGDALDNLGQRAEAISQYRAGFDLKPDAAAAHNNLGNILLKDGQLLAAIEQYREAVHLMPEVADFHLNLGTALNKNDQTDEAIQQFQKTLQLRPSDARTHNNLGIALLIKGKTDDAINHFQEAIHLNPDYALAQTNLARAMRIKNGL